MARSPGCTEHVNKRRGRYDGNKGRVNIGVHVCVSSKQSWLSGVRVSVDGCEEDLPLSVMLKNKTNLKMYPFCPFCVYVSLHTAGERSNLIF